jgi:TPR repeat protein
MVLDFTVKDIIHKVTAKCAHMAPGTICITLLVLLAGCGSLRSAGEYRAAANPVDPLEQYYLGLRYFEGNGVAQDYRQAVYWFRKAVEQGDADAIGALEIMGYQ